jgi:hypothetical protein
VRHPRCLEFEEVSSIIGTSESATFVLLIAVINGVNFLEVFKAFRAAWAGKLLLGGRFAGTPQRTRAAHSHSAPALPVRRP